MAQPILPVLALAAGLLSYTAIELPFSVESSKTSRKYLLESMTGGVALIDYDGDGLIDIYFVNGAALADPMAADAMPVKSDPKYWNRLYRNSGEMRFVDVTEKAGLRGAGYGMGAAAADFDNDGDADLYVTAYGANQLFRNDGGRFRDITAEAGVAGGGWSTGAAWVDIDNDGLLDLFVARYLEWSFADIWCGARKEGYRSYCHPDQFKPVSHLLFRNLGGGRFVDITAASGLATAPGKGLGVAIGDYDLDGLVDIAVANDAFPQQLFRNAGKARLRETALEANAAYDDDGRVFSGMGIDLADYDNDGRPDLAINALAGQRYALFRNVADGFEYASPGSGVASATRGHSGWGLRFADLDNDGWKDLVVAQGHVMDNIELTQPGTPYREPMLILRNTAGKFAEAPAGDALSVDRAARGMAVGDLDNDGTLELVVAAQESPAVVFRRAPGSNHWLTVALRGHASNRQGIGARVTVGGQAVTVSTASSYLASNDPRAHFGLGASADPVTVEVRWPSGKVQRVEGAPVDRVMTIEENR
ncbi:MAG: CRTAC1 family protein [Bryobacteraceae bacterium]